MKFHKEYEEINSYQTWNCNHIQRTRDWCGRVDIITVYCFRN